ncbi:MAG: hypothetical protein AAFR16_13775, partial [Pseudomonadota bacterium]
MTRNRRTLAAAALAAAAAAAAAPAPSAAQTPYAAFEGAKLVAISDGDMLASAYVNGALGPRESADALSVVTMTPDLSRLSIASVPVSNSVAGAPTAVAVTPDGRYAVVSESFGPRPEDGETFRDLPIGALLTLVDITDPAAPTVAQTLEIGVRPEGLSISPDGGLVAVTLHPRDGRGIAFVPLEDGRFGAPSYASPPGAAPENRLSHVEWRPSGDFIAVNDVDRALIRFARVVRDESAVRLEPWGAPVLTSKYPFMGRFTP